MNRILRPSLTPLHLATAVVLCSFVLACGGVTIYVEPGHTRRPDDPAVGCGIAPAFAADSVLATHKLLAAAGVPMLGEIQHPNEEFAMFQCLDPDGNLIEFAGAP